MFCSRRNFSIIIVYIIISLFFNNSDLFAENSLLWKISGNGLEKESYLYGTIHLKYDNFFEIGDSAYMALNKCEAFAGEVNLDSILYYFDLKKDEDIEIDFDSIFTKEEIDSINQRLLENLGITLDETKKNYLSYWFESLYKIENAGNKRETFIDGYLFYYSKCLGKKIKALEYRPEYSELLSILYNKNTDIRNTILEKLKDSSGIKLIENYLNQDIEGLYSIKSDKKDSLLFYKLIIERNFKMANRMVNLMNENSTFFAVGAGHLGGDEGLIKLLRKKGYIVEPVRKIVTAYSENIKFDSKNIKWKEIKNTNIGFQLELPDKPVQLESLTSLFYYFDIGSGIYYSYTFSALEETNIDKIYTNLDLVINKIKLNWINYSEISRQVINFEKIKGYELEFYTGEYYLKLYLYHKDNFIYSFTAYTYYKNKDSYDISRYFNSIKLIPIVENDWFNYKPEDESFSIDLPGEPEYMKLPLNEYPNLSSYETYSLPNILTKHNFNVFVYNLNNRIYFDKNEVLHNMANGILSELHPGIEFDTTKINTDDINGFVYTEKSINSKTAFKLAAYNALNKIYILYGSNTAKSEYKDIDRFINSFKINFKNNSNLTEYVLDKGKILLPAIPEKDTSKDENSVISDKFEKKKLYFSTDSATGLFYVYFDYTLNEFYQNESDSVEFFEYLTNMQSEGDTVMYSKFYTENNISVLDYKVINPNEAEIATIGKYISKGRNIYGIYSMVLPSMYKKYNVDSVLNSLRCLDTTDNWDIDSDKRDNILAALNSSDTTKVNFATKMISSNKFNESHLDRIFEILLKEQHNDTLEYGSKALLIDKLAKINNQKVFDFIKKNYAKINKSPFINLAVCDLFSEMGTKESAEFILENINNIKCEDIRSYEFSVIFYNIKKNYKDWTDYFPKIMELQKDSVLSYSVNSLLNDAIDENAFDNKVLKNYENQILDYCREEYRKSLIVDSSDENFYRSTYDVYSGSKLLLNFAVSNSSAEYFKQILNDEDDDLKIIGIAGQLKFNVKVEDSLLKSTAKEIYSRNTFYKILKSINKLDYFPKEYKTQKSIAEAEFSNYLEEEDYTIDTAIYVDERIRVKDGKKSIYYIFKYLDNSDEEFYTGWTGPYPMEENPNELICNSEHIYTNYEKYNRLEIERNFDKWIDDYEKELLEYKTVDEEN